MNHYRTITFQPPASTLSNFPLLVRIQNDPMTTRITSSYGYDVSFEDSEGNALAFDLDYYDPTTHSGAWWVKIPSLPSGSPTTIKMRYGDSSITTNQSTPTTVWSDYAAVYHLSELNGTSQLNSADGVQSTAGLTSPSFQTSNKGTGRVLRFTYSGSAEDKTKGIKTQTTLTSPNYSVTMIANNSSAGSPVYIFMFSPNYSTTLGYENQVNMTLNSGYNYVTSGKYPHSGYVSIRYTSSDLLLFGASFSKNTWRYTQIGTSFNSGNTGEDLLWSNYTEFLSLTSGWQGNFTFEVDELRLCKTAHDQDWMTYENANYMNHAENTSYGPEMNADGTRTIKLFPGMFTARTLD